MAAEEVAEVSVWLPGATDPVVAGRLVSDGAAYVFLYGASYLGRSDAVPLFLPELPLVRGAQRPRSGVLPGCIADSGPDGWGRRVIELGRTGSDVDLTPLGYLVASGSDGFGALAVHEVGAPAMAAGAGSPELTDLARAAERVEQGEPLPLPLERALLDGTSVGGARPKAVLVDGQRALIAKFSSTADAHPVVRAEAVAMDLARRVGLDVAPVEVREVLGRAVLLVERFDRPPGGGRRMGVSALTLLELHDADGIAGRYATYVDLAHQIRARFTAPDATLRELFARITFNVIVGNTDDHGRNHAAFWDGEMLTLTPAYDICPQNRTGGEAFQAMAYGEGGERRSRLDLCIAHAETYHLAPAEAADIVEHQVAVVHDEWHDACDLAGLAAADRDRLWGRQILNPSVLQDG